MVWCEMNLTGLTDHSAIVCIAFCSFPSVAIACYLVRELH